MPPPNTVPLGNKKRFPLITLLVGILAGGVFVGVAAAFFLGIQVPSAVSENMEVRTGVYLLEGLSPGATDLSSSYTGMVAIYKAGAVYDVSWYIGDQRQWGVGIVNGDILSVSYTDDTGGTTNDFGVVSYRIVPEGLQGEWASALGYGNLGTEKLTWRKSVSDSYVDPERSRTAQEELDGIADAIEYEENRLEGDTSPNPYGEVTIEESGNVTNVYVD